jgi:CDP-diacylglycerol--serine O-phosphatidyltransferase
LSGCFAVVLSFSGNFKAALFMIIASAIFDFCDGFAARLLKAYSPMGKELDSLADMVSFGLAPATIMFNKMLEYFKLDFQEGADRLASLFNLELATSSDIFSKIITLPLQESACYMIPLLCALSIAVFSGLRLAKFNIDTRQTENFIGLATPSCALMVGSLIYACETYPQIDAFFAQNVYILAIVSVVLALLLVSEIPMFSFKFKSLRWADNRIKFSFLICAVLIAVVQTLIMGGFSLSIWIFTTFVCYILLNVCLAIVPKR